MKIKDKKKKSKKKKLQKRKQKKSVARIGPTSGDPHFDLLPNAESKSWGVFTFFFLIRNCFSGRFAISKSTARSMRPTHLHTHLHIHSSPGRTLEMWQKGGGEGETAEGNQR